MAVFMLKNAGQRTPPREEEQPRRGFLLENVKEKGGLHRIHQSAQPASEPEHPLRIQIFDQVIDAPLGLLEKMETRE
jgi:hypothetical protein